MVEWLRIVLLIWDARVWLFESKFFALMNSVFTVHHYIWPMIFPFILFMKIVKNTVHYWFSLFLNHFFSNQCVRVRLRAQRLIFGLIFFFLQFSMYIIAWKDVFPFFIIRLPFCFFYNRGVWPAYLHHNYFSIYIFFYNQGIWGSLRA